MRTTASVSELRGGLNTIIWSNLTAPPAARMSSARIGPGPARMSTTTISLPRPFILTKAWSDSALMGNFCGRPYRTKRRNFASRALTHGSAVPQSAAYGRPRRGRCRVVDTISAGCAALFAGDLDDVALKADGHGARGGGAHHGCKRVAARPTCFLHGSGAARGPRDPSGWRGPGRPACGCVRRGGDAGRQAHHLPQGDGDLGYGV